MQKEIKEYLVSKAVLDQAKESLLKAETALYKARKRELDAKAEGTVTINEGIYVVKVTKKLNRTIDQKKAEEFGGVGLVKKYSFSKTEYNRLPDSNKAQIDNCMITKPGKPGFKVEVRDENN